MGIRHGGARGRILREIPDNGRRVFRLGCQRLQRDAPCSAEIKILQEFQGKGPRRHERGLAEPDAPAPVARPPFAGADCGADGEGGGDVRRAPDRLGEHPEKGRGEFLRASPHRQEKAPRRKDAFDSDEGAPPDAGGRPVRVRAPRGTYRQDNHNGIRRALVDEQAGRNRVDGLGKADSIIRADADSRGQAHNGALVLRTDVAERPGARAGVVQQRNRAHKTGERRDGSPARRVRHPALLVQGGGDHHGMVRRHRLPQDTVRRIREAGHRQDSILARRAGKPRFLEMPQDFRRKRMMPPYFVRQHPKSSPEPTPRQIPRGSRFLSSPSRRASRAPSRRPS